ncbi:MAG: TSUP family transporter [Methylobacter sp.]|nr:TSUP family transporter [Methylobacter sp.]MDP2100530.1 TSUP family transporter [Methylobacter sp.]MDP2428717.1 TSUP family transporter [Methylobacter sp.]MDP3053267.1 TSUP family transporter [Methylobacter sp.]MDP3361534.1 TSUP family transporter [Methylobacter sp.]
MPVDILLTVFATSVIQSIFGVGVLLFGTPLLLLLGYGFVDALGVLLPVSIAISALQALRHYDDIDTGFYKKLLIYCIPFVVLFLVLVTTVKINISLIIGAVLIFVALRNFSAAIENALQLVVKYEKAYLMAIGLVHGLSNLGGSLLTVIVYSKKYPKDKMRVTTAVSYGTFALFQLATLFFVGSEFGVPFADRVSLVQIAVAVFLLTEELIYNDIDNEKYNKIFAVFLFTSGILLIAKAL